MWFFNNKKDKLNTQNRGPLCTNCKGSNTQLSPGRTGVRIWRGQRYLVCRCLDCAQDFYVEDQKDRSGDNPKNADGIIEDEEALNAAEDDIRLQAKEDGDRTCR